MIINIWQVPLRERDRMDEKGCYPVYSDRNGVSSYFIDADGNLWGGCRVDRNGEQRMAAVRGIKLKKA